MKTSVYDHSHGMDEITQESAQGRKQDFGKGGADARREMALPLRSEVWGLPGIKGLTESNDHMFLE